MKVSDFDFDLPETCIAQEPLEPRDAARLLVHERGANRTRHHRVCELDEELSPGDLLVVNDTRVLPARLQGRRASGGAVELLFLEPVTGGATWRVLARPAKRLSAGDLLTLADGRVTVRLVRREERADGGLAATWLAELAGEQDVESVLEREGRMPLPPYIRRAAGHDERDGADRERYQTVFARARGAVAAPTAGLHLTHELLERLAARGVEHAAVTLHVGMGTFLPVQVEDVSDHVMHAERFVLSEETVRAIARCRARGGRVVAVGTTTVRVLESCAAEDGSLRPQRGSTSIFISPGYVFRSVDALITNFHLPRSTLLMLVSALVGRTRMLDLYREAIAHGYRFYSYGDAMLLLP